MRGNGTALLTGSITSARGCATCVAQEPTDGCRRGAWSSGNYAPTVVRIKPLHRSGLALHRGPQVLFEHLAFVADHEARGTRAPLNRRESVATNPADPDLFSWRPRVEAPSGSGLGHRNPESPWLLSCDQPRLSIARRFDGMTFAVCLEEGIDIGAFDALHGERTRPPTPEPGGAAAPGRAQTWEMRIAPSNVLRSAKATTDQWRADCRTAAKPRNEDGRGDRPSVQPTALPRA